jgi:hypothetical protein
MNRMQVCEQLGRYTPHCKITTTLHHLYLLAQYTVAVKHDKHEGMERVEKTHTHMPTMADSLLHQHQLCDSAERCWQ